MTLFWVGSGMWPGVIHNSHSGCSMLMSDCVRHSPVLTPFNALLVFGRTMTYSRRSRGVEGKKRNEWAGKEGKGILAKRESGGYNLIYRLQETQPLVHFPDISGVSTPCKVDARAWTAR